MSATSPIQYTLKQPGTNVHIVVSMGASSPRSTVRQRTDRSALHSPPPGSLDSVDIQTLEDTEFRSPLRGL